MRRRLAAWLMACAVFPFGLGIQLGAAEDWGMFRGPQGNGVAPEGSYPTAWSSTEHVVWKVKLPSPANGSPIVANGRVFVTSSADKGRERSLICFDRANGKEVWTRTERCKDEMPTHASNPYGGSTPASDGERVVVWHATAGLHAYDMAGKPVWSRDLGEFRHQWGYGTSPVIHQDRVYLHSGPGKRVFVAAFRLADGTTVWETEEPQDGNGETRADGRDMGSWSTPVVVPVDGANQLVCAMPTRLNAYDCESGKIVWSCNGLSGPNYSVVSGSPIVGDGLCVIHAGFRGPSMGIRIGGQGDITASGRLWLETRNPESISTGVLVDGHVYRANGGPGTIECVDAKTGKVLWKARAAGENYWASVILAGGHLYVTGGKGTTVVFKADPAEFAEVARNKIDEACNATPAFSDGQIFVRTFENLYCVGG